uniref:GST N-terminal domain-containing protein n=1 Tax=Neovison vison TaxID=452646 RepID=A0A8C7BF26_NEOVI
PGDSTRYHRLNWLTETFKLSMDFLKLPYLIDKTHEITQSHVFLHCIAHKHNL